MSSKWTENQRRAIDICGKNALVSAGAGSGKTAVLVEHVIKKITDDKNPVDIDKLLVVTFTKAAAAEMRERIYNTLIKMIEENPKNTNLRRQISLLSQAQIATVHSFCSNLLKNEFHRIGISSDFEIGDTAVLSGIKKTAIEEVLEERYENPTPEFINLIDSYGDIRDDKTLIDIIYQIYDFLCSIPNARDWLNNAVKMYETGTNWTSFIIPFAEIYLKGILDGYNDALFVISENEEIKPYYGTFSEDKNKILKLYGCLNDGWDAIFNNLKEFNFSKLPSKVRNTTNENSDYVKEIRENAKSFINSLSSIFNEDADGFGKENKILLPVIKEVCSLTFDFWEKFSQMKQEQNLFDFNDLEFYTLKLLQDEEYVSSLRNRYIEILVDEYQDTNGVQSKIFSTLSNGSNLFFVGDVKQSIYGFRNANPYNFMECEKSYSNNSDLGENISLSHNFRSSSGVIDFINKVFSVIMTEYTGGVDYKNGHTLIYGNKDIKDWDSSVEIMLSDTRDKETDGLSSYEREAYITADKIQYLVNIEKPLIYDKESKIMRPLKYSDIAILVRSNNNCTQYSDCLAAWGVPVFSEKKGGYFNTTEIAVIIAFLEIIDNPMQDIPLLAVLRSPMFSFTDNELASIKGENKKDCFYNCLKKSDSKRASDFLEILNSYIKLSKIKTVEQMIKRILTDTGYISFVGTLPSGEERVANLRLLCKRASDFESVRGKGIAEFINYIKLIRESTDEYTTAKIIGENDDVVRVMTIHKSKGLEFPVVFVCRCGTNLGLKDASGKFIIDRDMGIATDVINSSLGFKYKSMSKSLMAQKIKLSGIREEMRTLYVALTRAREKLFIVADVSKPEEMIAKYSLMNRENNEYKVLSMSKYIEWILYAVNSQYAKIYTAPSEIDYRYNKTENKEIKVDEKVYEEIDERLSYEYPYEYTCRIPSKMSVSEIAGMGEEVIHLNSVNFGDESNMNAALRGTVIHFVMQNIDLSDTENISEQILKMYNKGMLTKEQLDCIDATAIKNFFDSEIGKRLLSAEDIHREYKFFVEMPSEYVMDDSAPQNDEKVIIQGVIDCFFIENGEIVILDYKTGKMYEKYKKQIKIYELCLEKATGIKVKETVLYPLI